MKKILLSDIDSISGLKGETTAEIFMSQNIHARRYDTKCGIVAGALRGYIRAAITRRKIQIRYSIMARRALVHGAIKERRDNVNDENREVRAVRDERWFYNYPPIYIYFCILPLAFYLIAIPAHGENKFRRIT